MHAGDGLSQNFKIDGRDFSRAGRVSTTIKEILQEVGIDIGIIRRAAIACYEAAGIEFAQPTEIGQRAAGITHGEIEGHPHRGGSTWQSLARGSRSIETDYLNGEIALLGSLHGVPTPYNRALQHAASQAAREGRPPGSLKVDELAL